MYEYANFMVFKLFAFSQFFRVSPSLEIFKPDFLTLFSIKTTEKQGLFTTFHVFQTFSNFSRFFQLFDFHGFIDVRILRFHHFSHFSNIRVKLEKCKNTVSDSNTLNFISYLRSVWTRFWGAVPLDLVYIWISIPKRECFHSRFVRISFCIVLLKVEVKLVVAKCAK